MSEKTNIIVNCDMRKDCTNPVSMIDERGFVYCASHGKVRKFSMRCRELTKEELDIIKSGKPIREY